jgi:hypothetical protein
MTVAARLPLSWARSAAFSASSAAMRVRALLRRSLGMQLDMPILLTEDPQAIGAYTPKGEAARERRWTGKHRMLVLYEHISSWSN